MREIVVISGKGGTGKTSVCAALAHLASGGRTNTDNTENAHRLVICDLDVDAPDLHLLLSPSIRRREAFISGNQAEITPDKCTACGTCAKLCKFDAVQHRGDAFTVDPLHCEGCGVCFHLCPAGAITFPERECGEWYVSDTRFGVMAHALLNPGQENSGRLVSLLKQQARELAGKSGAETILCDGSPGVGCPVISSLSGATLAVAVVEPTPSGVHDFERVAALCDHFHIPVTLIINKCDLNPEETARIRKLAGEKDRVVAAELPFSPDVTRAMIAGLALTETDSPLGELLARAWERIDGLASRAAARKTSNL